jgi:hypothetical protein
MTTPTPAELKAEIESGPLAASLAGPWATVFETEPEPQLGDFDPPDQQGKYDRAVARRERIAPRFGTLTPDGIHDLFKVLRDPSLSSRRVPRTMALGDLIGAGFEPASVGAVFLHDRFTEFRDVVNKQDHAGAKEMATMFAATGTIQPSDVAAFVAYADATVNEACSRLTAREWEVTEPLLQAAKAV